MLDIQDLGDINDSALAGNTADSYEKRYFTARYAVGNRHPDYQSLNFTSQFPVHVHAAIVIKHNNCDNEMEQTAMRNQLMRCVYRARPNNSLNANNSEHFTVYTNALFSCRLSQLETILANNGPDTIITYYTGSTPNGETGWHEQRHTTGEEWYGGCNPVDGDFDDPGGGG